jgi:signal transduction histidine kinase/ActR/RegA family two-component response regulator
MAELWRRRLRYFWGAPVAALLVLSAHLLRIVVLTSLGASHPFITFYPAVLLAAVVAGARAGLVATALSAVAADYFWISPFATFLSFDANDLLAMLSFIGSGLLISGLALHVERSRERLRATEAEERASLEAKVAAISADLTRNQRRFTTALLNSRVSVWEQDTELRYTWMWNPKLGYDLAEVIGKRDGELMDAACLEEVEAFKRAVMAGGGGRQREVAVAAPGRPCGWFDLYAEAIRGDDGQVTGLTCVAVDITERVALERQLRTVTASLEREVEAEVAAREGAQRLAAQAERMQALGRLAGGIAHDLNNVLQAIDGAADLIQKRADAPAEVRMLVSRVTEAVDRGAATTRRLLTFSRGGNLRAEPVDVASLLEGVAAILRDTLGANIQIDIQADETLPAVLADRAQLETVLLNLGTNARDAMPNGGLLTLAADVGDKTGVQAEGLLRLRVTDDGLGMEPATLARAAEPLFTTKPAGRGTGLGLSMARAFAEQSGGLFNIESAPGAGATVSLWLPTTALPAAMQSNDGVERAPAVGLSGRILLVDDEAFVRETLGAVLRDAGFTVVEAGNAEQALAVISGGEHSPVDALVSDLSMPGAVDGLSLIRIAWGHAPGLPAILLTGHLGTEAEASLDFAARVGISLLRKPTSGQELAHRLGALLAARAPPNAAAAP